MNAYPRKFVFALVAPLLAAAVMAAAPTPSPSPAPAATVAPADVTKPAGLRVFYASHSLMWDMPPVLTQEAEAYGIKGHTVLGIQRLGVSRTSQHWEMADAQNQAKQALRTGNVDAFVMSPIGMPDEGITNFVKLGLEHNKNMKFYIQVSWPGMGLVDNNDMGSGAGGMPGFGGAPGGGFGGPGAGRGAPAGGRGPGAAPGRAPGAAPGAAPAGPSAAPAPGGAMIDPFEQFWFVAVPATPAAPPAPAAPGAAPGARGGPGAPGARGGFGAPGGGAPGGFGGMMGGMGGGQNYNKTPEEIAQINVRNKASAEEQAKKINQELGNGKTIIFLVPTDQAHNALRLLIAKKEMPGMTDQGEVFADAIGHPTPPVIALNTYVHFAVLYNRNPIGLPVPTVLKNANKPAYREESFNKKLQEIAWDIVSKYPPSGVTAQ
jgi:hypothetical protein